MVCKSGDSSNKSFKEFKKQFAKYNVENPSAVKSAKKQMDMSSMESRLSEHKSNLKILTLFKRFF